MKKRQKIAISSLILAIALTMIPVIQPEFRIFLLAATVVASYFLSLWSVYGQFSGIELVTLFALPVILTSSFGLFFNEFDTDVSQRAILGFIYFAVMYTILLSSNIFNVSIERNIPLVRAARTIGYVATLFVSFAVFTLAYGLHLDVFIFTALVLIISTLLFAQGLWQINLKQSDWRQLSHYSLISGSIVAQVALAFAFWPLDATKIGLALTVTVYVLLGVITHVIKNDLKKRAVSEYLFVALALISLLIATTSWGV